MNSAIFISLADDALIRVFSSSVLCTRDILALRLVCKRVQLLIDRKSQNPIWQSKIRQEGLQELTKEKRESQTDQYYLEMHWKFCTLGKTILLEDPEFETLVLRATTIGHQVLVCRLIRDLPMGHTLMELLLLQAIRTDQKEIELECLENSKGFNYGKDVLCAAAKKGRADLIGRIAEPILFLNLTKVIKISAGFGHTRLVQFFIAHESFQAMPEEAKRTACFSALCFAKQMGHQETCKFLEQESLDEGLLKFLEDFPKRYSQNLLSYIKQGDIELVELMMEREEANKLNFSTLEDILEYIIKYDLQIFELLLKNPTMAKEIPFMIKTRFHYFELQNRIWNPLFLEACFSCKRFFALIDKLMFGSVPNQRSFLDILMNSLTMRNEHTTVMQILECLPPNTCYSRLQNILKFIERSKNEQMINQIQRRMNFFPKE